MRYIIFVILLTLSFTQVSAQTSEQTKPKETADTSEQKKSSDYLFNYKISLPKEWTVLTLDDAQATLEITKEIDNSVTDEGEKFLDNSHDRTNVLFHISKKPFGSTDNAIFIGAVERLKVKGISTKAMVLLAQINFRQNLGYEIVKPTTKIILDGRSFYYFKLKKTLENGATFFQNIYFLKLNDSLVLQFGLIYKNSEDFELMMKHLNTFKFNKNNANN